MTSQMLSEIREIPESTNRLIHDQSAALAKAASALREQNPTVLLTIARGSSDHAASYLKYAFEIGIGVPVASIGPSVASIFGAKLRLQGAAALAISQSGQSPDIIKTTVAAKAGGALTLAITNEPNSPLAGSAQVPLPLDAGPEKSVAATKTFVSTVVAGLLILAHWSKDAALLDAISALPEEFEQAINSDWSAIGDRLGDTPIALTLGRGPSFAIATEAALKLKEVAQIASSAYSSAEVMHGPVSIVGPGTPALIFVANDEAATSSLKVSTFLRDVGANVFITGRDLSVPQSNHALTSALTQIVCFYTMVERLAWARGLDPDTPRNLNKVTKTE